jgi:hypothetical protein
MSAPAITFFVDLYIVRKRAEARKETAAVEKLKELFPEIFKKENEEIYEYYCQKKRELRAK